MTDTPNGQRTRRIVEIEFDGGVRLPYTTCGDPPRAYFWMAGDRRAVPQYPPHWEPSPYSRTRLPPTPKFRAALLDLLEHPYESEYDDSNNGKRP